MAHNIVTAKENLKMSYDGPSQGKESNTYQRIKALCQGHQRAIGPTHRRADPRTIKEETTATNRDLVYNQAYRLSHGIHAVSHFFIMFNYPLNGSLKLGVTFPLVSWVRCGT